MSQQDFSDLTIISPTLNEEKNIGELLRVLTEIFTGARIIIVDDGSKDRTAAIVTEWSSNTPLVSLLDRREQPVKGLTASVLDGILQATTEYFLVIDADLQHPPLIIKEIYDLLRQDLDLVAGVRKPYQENQGWHRIVITRLATKLAKLYLQVLKKMVVTDPMSGFFTARTKDSQQKIRANYQRFELRGYKVFFDLLKVSSTGLKYGEVEYQFSFRTHGKSKLSPKHAFYFLRGLLH